MRKLIFLVFALVMSCSELIDAPKNLIPKDKMSQLVADFALDEQLIINTPNTDLENSTRFDLNKYKVKGVDFTESYKYYLATGELEKILTDAQQIILEKDPAAKDFIEKKLKENKNVPSFAR